MNDKLMTRILVLLFTLTSVICLMCGDTLEAIYFVLCAISAQIGARR